MGIKVEIDEDMTRQSSFPWEVWAPDSTPNSYSCYQLVQEFTDRHVSDLAAAEERQGKAYLFYPIGMTMRAVDDVFGEDIDFTMDDGFSVIGTLWFAITLSIANSTFSIFNTLFLLLQTSLIFI